MAQRINTVQYRFPTGMIMPFAGFTAPTNTLLCDGSAVSRTTYADLFALLNPQVGTFTVTIASPGVFTRTAHGFQQGEAVFLTTTGSLLTGLSQNTVYYVNVINANTFNLATNRTNVGAIHINTSGSQSGTHTIWRSPYGVGNGSTTFNTPDLRGKVIAGNDNLGGTAANQLNGYGGMYEDALGAVGGADSHTLVAGQIPPLGVGAAYRDNNFGSSGVNNGLMSTQAAVGFTGGIGQLATIGTNGNAHNNLQPTMVMRYVIAI